MTSKHLCWRRPHTTTSQEQADKNSRICVWWVIKVWHCVSSVCTTLFYQKSSYHPATTVLTSPERWLTQQCPETSPNCDVLKHLLIVQWSSDQPWAQVIQWYHEYWRPIPWLLRIVLVFSRWSKYLKFNFSDDIDSKNCEEGGTAVFYKMLLLLLYCISVLYDWGNFFMILYCECVVTPECVTPMLSCSYHCKQCLDCVCLVACWELVPVTSSSHLQHWVQHKDIRILSQATKQIMQLDEWCSDLWILFSVSIR